MKKKKNHIKAERKKIKEGTSIYLQKASYYCNASISKVENSAVFAWAEKKMSPSDETKKKYSQLHGQCSLTVYWSSPVLVVTGLKLASKTMELVVHYVLLRPKYCSF